MTYKITLLAENTTYRHNTIAQHGQSILIESLDYRLLFDVGEIPHAVTYNMKQLGIEVKDISDFVISHRHIDHIGALVSMIPEFTSQGLYLPMQLGESNIKNHPEKYNFLKPNPDGGYDLAISAKDVLEINKYQNIKLVENEGIEIHKDIYTTGCIGDWMMEQAVVIDQKELGLTVILGCSHPGVEALVEKAKLATGNSKVRGIIGGMHFTDFSQQEMKEHANNLKKYNLEFVVPSHCTTVAGAIALKEELGDIIKLSKTYTFGVGNRIEVGENIQFFFVD
jgi:7,8-dihydropterin-6-yl-methyl-4-(beta-D-ribofuranosyl)aminobenzene 5'-phosphate synthase